MKLTKNEIDELWKKTNKPYAYIIGRHEPVLKSIVEYVDQLIRDRIALALDGEQRAKPIDAAWLESLGWMPIRDHEEEFTYLALNVDYGRRLEWYGEECPICLTARNAHYDWEETGIEFKNDGTRGPILDLMRVLEI